MSTIRYSSESARANAVLRYFIVSYVATLLTFSLFLAVAAYAGVVNLVLVLLLIAAQNLSWIVCGVLMTAVFDSLNSPPAPPEKTPKDDGIKERIIPVYKGKRIG